MPINSNKEYCYRICHLQNLPHILREGLCTKHHPNADPDFIPIGNPLIIKKRGHALVRINEYGNIGDYVPFYFTPRYNIVTGHSTPVVPKVERENILVIRAKIMKLAECDRFFFTDGQAYDKLTLHFENIESLGEMDWPIIQRSEFKNSELDSDKQRRYQAEFLVHNHVPVSYIESLNVCSPEVAIFVKEELDKACITLPVNIKPEYFFK